jgi:hypothetical protein
MRFFAMDFENAVQLLTQFPQARNKLLLLNSYAEGEQHHRPNADPYLGDQEGTSRCYARRQTCVSHLVKSLWSITNQGASYE